jgi:hypothetical protein
MPSAYVLLNVLCAMGKNMANAYDKETSSDHYGYFYPENNCFSETKWLYSKANGTLSTEVQYTVVSSFNRPNIKGEKKNF